MLLVLERRLWSFWSENEIRLKWDRFSSLSQVWIFSPKQMPIKHSVVVFVILCTKSTGPMLLRVFLSLSQPTATSKPISLDFTLTVNSYSLSNILTPTYIFQIGVTWKRSHTKQKKLRIKLPLSEHFHSWASFTPEWKRANFWSASKRPGFVLKMIDISALKILYFSEPLNPWNKNDKCLPTPKFVFLHWRSSYSTLFEQHELPIQSFKI